MEGVPSKQMCTATSRWSSATASIRGAKRTIPRKLGPDPSDGRLDCCDCARSVDVDKTVKTANIVVYLLAVENDSEDGDMYLGQKIEEMNCRPAFSF
jgi:hypothetical protein